MRFSESFWNVPSALLATAALILLAGVAGAILNADGIIIPDSPKYDGSGGYVDANGDLYETGVWLSCEDIDNDFRIGCDSDHPDSVNISRKQGKVDQKKRDNNADAWIAVDEMGGITEDAVYPLDCDRVQIKGKLNDDKMTIESQCTLTKCEVPGDLTLDQIRSAEDCMEDSEDNGDLGKSVTTLKLDNNNLLKGKIKSKGMWLLPL
jgi:hypothetical protein